MTHPAIARIANRPLAIHPLFADTVFDTLGTLDAAALTAVLADAAPRQYGLIEGVALIPVCGALVKDASWWMDCTTYGWIREGFLAATIDPEVDAIAFLIDSPGGEVAGCFDLVDEIYAARGTKPIWAILDECAYSAAYAIASACDHITVPRTGGVGSIGVMAVHIDISKALSGAGIAVTFFQYGDRKTDGAAEKPLDREAKTAFQDDIDAMGELFIATVARNRNLTASKVRRTEAATFRAETGVANGLADAVMAPAAAFRALLSQLG